MANEKRINKSVATTDSMLNATILAKVRRCLIKQNYKQVDFVKKCTLLFEIDPRPFKATLAEVKAAPAKQKAVPKTAEANLNRILPLAAAKPVSQRDRDNAVGMVYSAEAQVLAAEAQGHKADKEQPGVFAMPGINLNSS